MFKILKIVKESIYKLNILEHQMKELSESNGKIIKKLKDMSVYSAIGMPLTENYDKHIQLLIEAKNRGYFNEKNYFTSIDGDCSNNSYFKHHYSSIASNYDYYEKLDNLMIPVIGVRGNFSACRISIYKNGKWAKIMCDNLTFNDIFNP